jgi:alpha-L-fucosidase
MNLDEIIEKVEALPSEEGLYVLNRPPIGNGIIAETGLKADDLKLLANHAKALAEAEKALKQLDSACAFIKVTDKTCNEIGDPKPCSGCIRARALQAISRIKEGRDK